MTAAANRATGEIVTACTEAEARAITERIKTAAEAIWSLLLEAHERHAWAALGYDRWEDYVRAEFDMTRGRAYQLLDQARVVREIGLLLPTAIAFALNDGSIGYVASENATWDQLLAGLEFRDRNITAAQAKREQYIASLDLLHPFMANDPACTVSDAIRRAAA